MPIGTSHGEHYGSEFDMLAATAGVAPTSVSQPRTDDKTPEGTLVPNSENNASAGSTDASRGIVDDVIRPKPDYMDPPERQTPFPRPRMSGIVSGLIDSAKKALSLTEAPTWAMDPVTGEYHTSPQAVERAAELASLAVLGPAPVASKLADGTLGSFAGVKSRMSALDKVKLREAQELEFNAAHPDQIWQQTGFFKGADQRWRYEIPDQNSSLNTKNLQYDSGTPGVGWTSVGREPSVQIKPSQLKKISDEELLKMDPDEFYAAATARENPTRLKDVLNHPELFDAYPFLKDMKIDNVPDHMRKEIGGFYSPSEKAIYMTPGQPDAWHSTLMHEVQHAIQDHEGFARGGNPGMFKSPEIQNAYKELDSIKKEIEPQIQEVLGDKFTKMRNLVQMDKEGALTSKGLTKQLDDFKKNYPTEYKRLNNILESERLLKEHEAKALEQYMRLMGEVESRNVQNRLFNDPMFNKLNEPGRTEDRARWLQTNP